MVTAAHDIVARVLGSSYLIDQFADDTRGPMKDICPFTLMGTFNRGITNAKRTEIAKGWADFLKIEEPIPVTFDGIPILNNLNSWFFNYEKNGHPDEINVLWEFFEEAIKFADSQDLDDNVAFIAAYNKTSQQSGVGWNLTMGLYWIRPWIYPTLEGQSRIYTEKKLGITIGKNGPKNRCSGSDYLELMDKLQTRFEEDTFPVHTFPELSYKAWLYPGDHGGNDGGNEGDSGDNNGGNSHPLPPYSIEEILADGCFLDRARLQEILERLRTKKNIILQGPPGTGKTWLAKRIAFSLMEARDENKLRAVQFHPNLSYEDFVRGWRPDGDGKLTLVDGPFMEMVKAALEAPKIKHVMVIEEINRGNPAQIFGEMLTLLEADKRTPSEALELCYRRDRGETVYVPANLYVIGTMNIADRSLALVDFALRRRFAFINLVPLFGKVWHDWVAQEFKIAPVILNEIEKRMLLLNEEIAADTNLGPQFQVGHSYVVPPTGAVINDARQWFRQVARTEIGPLLDEYWFDNLDKARKAVETLLEGF
ncbi:MAG: 5-methylcytosine-specific restriction enzyme B [Candidatus Hydrogenedentes bacterium ADurb.Bin179]|nr:MAG: 5-methylcytosine-specific restriction enzyme B [Candidatus Hydrogenedentes bacterium ADurb.Bin179]